MLNIKAPRSLIIFLSLISVFAYFIFLMHKSLHAEQFESNKLTIFYAAGLNASMNAMFKEFKKLNPSIEIIGESGGTLLLIRKITELNRQPDIIFVADAQVISDLLIPKYADWYINFYKDRVVIAYTSRSKYTNEINTENWYKILSRKDVRFGYASPHLAPLGYRTLMLWKLADLYYKDKPNNKSIYETLKESPPAENIMHDAAELLLVLESLSLDYAFVYESTAKQHNLKYIQLPPEIDLGNFDLEELYKQARVEVISKKGQKQIFQGSPIAFALTILKDAPNYRKAIEFIRLFLNQEGQKIMLANDQEMIIPCVAYNPKSVPEELRDFIHPRPKTLPLGQE